MKKNNLTYLFYLPSFSGGGSEMVTINLANQFYDHDKKVIFLCSNNSGPLYFKLNKKIEVLNKINNLHDHKGLLSVKWKNIPTEKDMSIIKEIWFSKIGDMSDTIEHLIINK